MEFSINNYSVDAKDKGWGNGWPTSRNDDMRKVIAETSDIKFYVHRRVARLVDIMLAETERRGYVLHPDQCGRLPNRPIRKSTPKGAE